MFKITRSQKTIRGATHQPKQWGVFPRQFAFRTSRDAWTDLVTHHIWIYSKQGTNFIRIVRTDTVLEKAMSAARIHNDRLRRQESMARRSLDAKTKNK